jgi:Holliday junction resolvase RusA-like endonuclease
MTWEFYAEGDPKGQPRPRAFAFHGKARMYDPATAEGWKASVAAAARNHGLHGVQTKCAVTVRMAFYFRRPKGHFGAKGLKPSAPLEHTQKPDVDNLQKAVLDALTQVGAWEDDSQVVAITASKGWSLGAMLPPGCSITIQTVCNTPPSSPPSSTPASQTTLL